MARMARVLVLDGGTSDEREISLRSGTSVIAALRAAGHDVREYDTASGINTATVADTDVVFPVLHGKGGEDGVLQAQLDALGVPYVGTGADASARCFDKWQFKQLLSAHDLPQAAGTLVDETGFWASELIRSPFVLKPNDGGSSVDTLIVRNLAQRPHKATIQTLFARHDHMLFEALIPGAEITVSVLGEMALPVVEIIPPESGEFDYENKYNGKTQELCPPEHVSAAAQLQAQDLALRTHKLAGCRDFSRTDMIIDSRGSIYILETNTIPGMTDQSLFPKAAAAAGITMPQLVDRLVQMALERSHRARQTAAS